MTGVSTWGPSQPSLLTMHHWPASLPFSAAYIEPQCCSNILMWPAARKYQKPSPTHAKILAAVLICLAWTHELGAGVNIVRGLPLSGAHKPGCTISSTRGCGLKQQNNLEELKAVVDVRPLSYTTQRHPTHCTKSVRQGIYIHQSVQKNYK